MSTASTLNLQVKGMSCGHCVKAVTQAVTTVDPQAQVQIDLASGQVQITTQANAAAIAAAITEEGYEVMA